jgi:hypothetical protein
MVNIYNMLHNDIKKYAIVLFILNVIVTIINKGYESKQAFGLRTYGIIITSFILVSVFHRSEQYGRYTTIGFGLCGSYIGYYSLMRAKSKKIDKTTNNKESIKHK